MNESLVAKTLTDNPYHKKNNSMNNANLPLQ